MFEMSYLNGLFSKSFPKFVSTEHHSNATNGLYESELEFTNETLPKK